MAPRIAVLSCLLLLVPAFTAGAEAGRAEPDYSRPGWYLGAGFSAGFEAFSDVQKFEDLWNEKIGIGDAFGVNARAGYRLLPWLALEGEFEWFSSFNVTTTTTRRLDLSVEDYTLTVNAKGYPLKGRVQPFGLIGVGGMLAQTTDELRDGRTVDTGGFVARFGGGIDYYLDEYWILTLDASYVVTTGNISGNDRTALGIGFQYRF